MFNFTIPSILSRLVIFTTIMVPMGTVETFPSLLASGDQSFPHKHISLRSIYLDFVFWAKTAHTHRLEDFVLLLLVVVSLETQVSSY